MYMTVTFDKAKEIMDNEEQYLIVDVREEEEYITGHADGARLFPVDDINENTAGEIIPSKDMPVLIYCRTGARSALAARKLCALGYTRVYDIGSLVGWPYKIVYGW